MGNHRALSTGLSLLFVLGAAALASCQTPQPESPSAGIASVQPPQPPDLGRGAPRIASERAYHIYVADPVRQVCSGPPPFFDFNSSEADDADQPTMKTLAECMVSGALRGRSIKLIGHTDPRGSVGYNETLGMKRAERVRNYLVAHGVDSSRITVESVGEDNASAAPKDWAKDRRVEVQLVK